MLLSARNGRDQPPVIGVEQDRGLEDVQEAARLAQDFVAQRAEVAMVETGVGVAHRHDQVVGIE